jgi:iron complex transport system ATP-binding protein
MTLEIHCGSYEYENSKPILQKFSFQVHSGEILAILGPNGSGKTTLIKCINGIQKWEGGQLLYNNTPLSLHNVSKYIAYVPQSHAITFPYKVTEMVLFGLAPMKSFFSMPTAEDKEKVYTILKKLKIEHLSERTCTEISGGEFQLVLIARALISNPKVILLDEPESHLDFKNQIIILDLLRSLTDNDGLICIFNTHYPDHALQIADKTLILRRGEHIFGNTRDVITKENLLEFFGVQVEFLPYVNKSGNHALSIVPIGVKDDNIDDLVQISRVMA